MPHPAPLVSVVIPAYNCSAYLAGTISSILAQGRDDLEVIVIDDGSTDNSGEIALGFGAPVKVLTQRNAGVCVARNLGMREARGEFIAFMDHDDYWLAHKLEHQLAAFRDNPQVDMVFGDFHLWNADGPDGRFPDPATFAVQAVRAEADPDYSGYIYHQMLLDSHVLTSDALARTRAVRDAGGFDESLPYSEDWDLWLRLSRTSQFLKLREKSTLYRQHAAQGSRIPRAVDYRTRLLENASARWGLCSADGRCLSRAGFKRQLAVYCAAFGLSNLHAGNPHCRPLAARAFLKAIRIDPTYFRSWAYLGLTPLGWRPKW